MIRRLINQKNQAVFLFGLLQVAGGLGLLALFGFSLWSTAISGWRDHPFDLANIRFVQDSLSFTTRLWAYDPFHLFGWTPNVFYNPLASLAGALFMSLFGDSEQVYRIWLVLVLLLTCLPLVLWLGVFVYPKQNWIWIVAGLLCSWLSLLVYPMDVGLLDANPVQVLYTGQWAQRLGVAWGLVALERLVRSFRAVDSDYRLALRYVLSAAVFFGLALFSHYMSGYATAVVMGGLSLWWCLAQRLVKKRFALWAPAICTLVFVLSVFLFLDFYAVFFSLNQSYHSLPLLDWEVPLGALATVQEVVIAALPLVCLPLVRLLQKNFAPSALSRALWPLSVFVVVWISSPGNLFWMFLLVTGASFGVCFVEQSVRPRHFLPVLAMSLLWLACAPDSLIVLGVDLSGLIPFSSSLGWAKLSAFARFLMLIWLGFLVLEELEQQDTSLIFVLKLVLVVAGLAVPLALNLPQQGRLGAQTFFAWMNQTDRDTQQQMITALAKVVNNAPQDGIVLVEDSLHHPKGSTLVGRVPHGHLVYELGQKLQRPVLGGAVTTRLVTHPLANTCRSKLLCKDFDRLAQAPQVVKQLAQLSISTILAHSPALIKALTNHPRAKLIGRDRFYTLFELADYRPLIQDEQGRRIPGAKINFRKAGLDLVLPQSVSQARLRLVWYPYLACQRETAGDCTLHAWREPKRKLVGCLDDRQAEIVLDIPWIEVETSTPRAFQSKPQRLQIDARPPLAPFVGMLFGWLCLIIVRQLWLRPRS